MVMTALEAAARSLAVELGPVSVGTADEIDTAFAAMSGIEPRDRRHMAYRR
jgi:hypothetical protein